MQLISNPPCRPFISTACWVLIVVAGSKWNMGCVTFICMFIVEIQQNLPQYILLICIPESSKGVKFQPLGLFLVVKGLKFHTFGGFRYLFFIQCCLLVIEFDIAELGSQNGQHFEWRSFVVWTRPFAPKENYIVFQASFFRYKLLFFWGDSSMTLS